MKKSVILGIISMAAGLATSYGQGYISLDSYSSNGVNGGVGPVFTHNGVALGSSFTAGLYFVVGTPVISDTPGNGIPDAQLSVGTGSGSTEKFAIDNTFSTAGYFGSIPSFNTGGAAGSVITLEIVAYETGDTYLTSPIRGHSAAFTMTSVAGTSPTSAYVTDAPGWLSQAGDLTVTSVPEPTTLALAGLGGLASLMALRRKQA